MQRVSVILAGLLLTAAVAPAQSTRVEVRAAEEAARVELRSQILAFQVSPGLTIKTLADRDPASISVESIVNDARPVGGLRWIERDVVQVQLQVPATRLLETLAAIPEAKRDPSLTADQLDRLNKLWAKRSFVATGQAIPPTKLASLVGTVSSPAWQTVTPADRAAAAKQAQAAASESIATRSANIVLEEPKQTVSEYFASPAARDSLRSWASLLPATGVTLREDRQMEVSLYVDKIGLNERLRSLVTPVALDSSEKSEALAAGIAAMPRLVIGRAPAPADENPALTVAPAWADQPITAEASSPLVQSRLRTARVAETAARDLLAKHIQSLPVENEMTLGQISEKDPRGGERIKSLVARARVYQVEYHADGSATVKVTLDSAEIMDELFRR